MTEQVGGIAYRRRLWDGPIAHLSNVGTLDLQGQSRTHRPCSKCLQRHCFFYVSLLLLPVAQHAKKAVVRVCDLETIRFAGGILRDGIVQATDEFHRGRSLDLQLPHEAMVRIPLDSWEGILRCMDKTLPLARTPRFDRFFRFFQVLLLAVPHVVSVPIHGMRWDVQDTKRRGSPPMRRMPQVPGWMVPFEIDLNHGDDTAWTTMRFNAQGSRWLLKSDSMDAIMDGYM